MEKFSPGDSSKAAGINALIIIIQIIVVAGFAIIVVYYQLSLEYKYNEIRTSVQLHLNKTSNLTVNLEKQNDKLSLVHFGVLDKLTREKRRTGRKRKKNKKIKSKKERNNDRSKCNLPLFLMLFLLPERYILVYVLFYSYYF
jgi:hypothetical protein